MKCIISDVNIEKDINKQEFIINSIKNIKKDKRYLETYTLWGKNIVINYVAIDEHDISISNNEIWVSEYKNDALMHQVLVQLDKLEMFGFTTEDDIEYCFKF